MLMAQLGRRGSERVHVDGLISYLKVGIHVGTSRVHISLRRGKRQRETEKEWAQ
jgi:hypothetical protein